jgi:hypothetical protein
MLGAQAGHATSLQHRPGDATARAAADQSRSAGHVGDAVGLPRYHDAADHLRGARRVDDAASRDHSRRGRGMRWSPRPWPRETRDTYMVVHDVELAIKGTWRG